MATIPRPPFVPFKLTPEFWREKDQIKHFVFHDTEGGGTVESLAGFFERTTYPAKGGGRYRTGIMYVTEPSGRCGSLGDFRKGVYHVENHNTECVGLEQIGKASDTVQQWFEKLHQLWAGAWIAAYVSQELGIPLVQSATSRRWIAPSGFCQHRDVPDNDHTDCGSGYPFDWVMGRARAWTADGVPSWVQLEIKAAT